MATSASLMSVLAPAAKIVFGGSILICPVPSVQCPCPWVLPYMYTVPLGPGSRVQRAGLVRPSLHGLLVPVPPLQYPDKLLESWTATRSPPSPVFPRLSSVHLPSLHDLLQDWAVHATRSSRKMPP